MKYTKMCITTMYIYFDKLNAVLTCEEYPQVLSVETMKNENLEYMCNKWEKTNYSSNSTFTLSFNYESHKCNCDNSAYTCMDDYDMFVCYNCGIAKSTTYANGTKLYLQNSGSIDIVCAKPNSNNIALSELVHHPQVYAWHPVCCDNHLYALHITSGGHLSDAHEEEINDNYHIVFADSV